jgi:ABC-type phosphate/phosphonate transport system permease subunit
MGDFLSIMSAAFDSFFGFIFWAVAYYRMNKGHLFDGPVRITLTVINIIIFALGLFLVGPGMYTSIEAIILDYAGEVQKPFSCAPNSL